MKLSNILVNNSIHLAVETPRGLVDATAAGCPLSMEDVISQGAAALEPIVQDQSLPTVAEPQYADVLSNVGKLVCVGLNYRAHAAGVNEKIPEYPILFSKFANALAPHKAPVELPSWEDSYDYEAELVIVMGKDCWNVDEQQAMDSIFGYTCGNDFSLRDAQMRSGQWLIGKTMPGFGPCGPAIVTADSWKPENKAVRSYVNGQLRQDGNVDEMIFSCAQIISYASKYIRLCPGDLIFTGTPSGVALEEEEKHWLKPGDVVDVEIEGLGILTNPLV